MRKCTICDFLEQLGFNSLSHRPDSDVIWLKMGFKPMTFTTQAQHPNLLGHTSIPVTPSEDAKEEEIK